MATNATEVTRIGVVLVHGVGEQRRFDHLSGEVNRLVAALEALDGIRVSLDTRSTQDSEIGAEHESWRADSRAPVKIDVVQTSNGREQRSCLCVHEVWWADLDDKDTLWNLIKFWCWGLGFWGVKKFDTTSLQGAQMDMQPPVFPPLPGGELLRETIVRVRLWCFANVFLLSALTLDALQFVLQRLGLGKIPGARVFYEFVGDVKLYQDRGRRHAGPLTDLNEPRRVPIRRRMVRVLLDAYRENYDRWYVLAHSLGTVAALNGLMETAHALPNYLTEEVWASLKASNDPVVGSRAGGPARSVAGMRPARPVWLTDDDAMLRRDVMFAKLRGLVTYGSPLDKFAYLWKQIVNINKDASCWRSSFEWVNVFEHTDPVSASLAAYSAPPAPAGSPQPLNLAYKACPILLLSHLKYLDLSKKPKVRPDQFVLRLVTWMLQGSSRFPEPGPTDRSWYRSHGELLGLALRLPWWVAGTAVLTAALAFVLVPAVLALLAKVPALAPAAASYADWSSGGKFGAVLLASAVVITLAGFVRRVVERYL